MDKEVPQLHPILEDEPKGTIKLEGTFIVEYACSHCGTNVNIIFPVKVEGESP